jgi:quinohemoprotein ethanol dehydrogenase
VNKPALVYPAPLGAHNWHPMSYSPRTGLVYIPVTERTTGFEQLAPDKFKINARTYNTGTISASAGITKLYAEPGAPPRGDVKSYLQAWDPVRGKEVWRVDAKDFGPAGAMVTASDIVFNGNWSGEFAAYDAKTGAKLWSAPTQANVVAAPSTYVIGGEQYVAVLVGARGLPKGQIRTNPLSANNSRLLVFKLGGTAHLPTAPASGASTIMTKLDPPLFTGTNEQVIDGQGAYARVCAGCHGANGTADKSIPDLRYSSLLRSISDWNTVVLDGARASKGNGLVPRHDRP